MNPLELSWNRAWSELSLEAPGGLFERLIAAYRAPHRSYHALQHLQECIAHFSEVPALAVRPGEVEIALWFHDAIYDPRSGDNELLSANLASEELSAAGAPRECQTHVHELIMATRHEAKPSEADQQLLVDIDLAILGASPARFNEYDNQVRLEYSWVPGFLYRMKRREVLKGFLSREHIYCTEYFRERYEQQARANLRAATGQAPAA